MDSFEYFCFMEYYVWFSLRENIVYGVFWGLGMEVWVRWVYINFLDKDYF